MGLHPPMISRASGSRGSALGERQPAPAVPGARHGGPRLARGLRGLDHQLEETVIERLARRRRFAHEALAQPARLHLQGTMVAIRIVAAAPEEDVGRPRTATLTGRGVIAGGGRFWSTSSGIHWTETPKRDHHVEVLRESRAFYIDARQNDISLMVDAMRSRAQRRKDTSPLVPFEQVIKYAGQIGEKAAQTRKKNEQAKAEAEAQAQPPATPGAPNPGTPPDAPSPPAPPA